MLATSRQTQAALPPPPSHRDIAIAAYYRWLARGAPLSQNGALDDWLNAEQDLLRTRTQLSAILGNKASHTVNISSAYSVKRTIPSAAVCSSALSDSALIEPPTKRLTMPTKKEVSETLEALISNGFDFLDKSTRELITEPAFSVSHFATGIELLLKARLFREHWTLVSMKPHGTPWSQIRDGSLQSIQASDLTNAITNVTGTPLKEETAILKKVFDHRNQALHFVPSQSVRDIAAEQFRVWFYLHRHLTDTWRDVYAAFNTRISKVDEELRKLKLRGDCWTPALRGSADWRRRCRAGVRQTAG